MIFTLDDKVLILSLHPHTLKTCRFKGFRIEHTIGNIN